MVEGRRVIVILEANHPRYLSAVSKKLLRSPAIDEIHIIAPQGNPALKAEVLHLKHTAQTRIKTVEESAMKYLMRRCVRENNLYVYLGPEVIWISPKAVDQLCSLHARWPDHLITFMSKAAADRTGYLMHVMGMLPDALLQPWHADYLFTYRLDHAEIQQEAHEQILYLSQTDQLHRMDFDRFVLERHEAPHCNAFCFSGEDMRAATFFIKSKEVEGVMGLIRRISQVALTDTSRINCLCGGAWVAEEDTRTQAVIERYLSLKEKSHD